MKFGVYLSPWDRPSRVTPTPPNTTSTTLPNSTNSRSATASSKEFWLDGAGSGGHVYNFPRIVEELRMLQPNTLVFADMALFEYGDIRWVGNEAGVISYEKLECDRSPRLLRWRPVEADTPLRKNHWFWHPNDRASLKSGG